MDHSRLWKLISCGILPLIESSQCVELYSIAIDCDVNLFGGSWVLYKPVDDQCVWFRLWCSVAFGSTVVEGDWPAEWNHTTILRWLATYHIYQASLHLYALPAHTHPWSVLSCNALPFVNYWTRPYLLDQPTINLHPAWTTENGRYPSCLWPFGMQFLPSSLLATILV